MGQVSTRREGLAPRWRWAVLALTAVAMALLLAVMVLRAPVADGAASAGAAPAGDAVSYARIIERMRGGEGYYPAAHDVLVADGYGTRSVFNWRTPAWPVILATLPPGGGQALLGALAAAGLLLTYRMFRAAGPVVAALSVLAVGLSFLVTTPILLLMSDRERAFVRGAFGRYLSPTLVERLSANPQALVLGGEERELTVLFSDIRGFTSMSEKMNPTELTALLNGFLTPMTDILLASEGTIDKYMGDAIMCFWNAPLDIAEHERKACLAALRMVDSLVELNRGRDKLLKVGIGLNSAPCCVGNLGSAQRFSYSAIGDGVNLASRVEGLTKAYGVSVLVTEPTRQAAGDLAFLEVDLVRVVGRADAVPIHTLIGDDTMAKTPAFRALATDHAELIAAYRAADPDRAEAALAKARAHASEDVAKLYDIYEERIAELRADPPPAGWDGVFTAKSK